MFIFKTSIKNLIVKGSVKTSEGKQEVCARFECGIYKTDDEDAAGMVRGVAVKTAKLNITEVVEEAAKAKAKPKAKAE